MTERQKLIEKARKIAALMSSPVACEGVAAASLLKKLLDDNNLTMQEIGLKNEDLSRKSVKESANGIKNSNLKDIIRTTKNSHEVSHTTDSNQIKEFIFKRPISELEIWFLTVIVKIARVHGCWFFGDRFGTHNERSNYLKIIGFPSDLEKLKIEIINTHRFIKGQIEMRGYVHLSQIVGYALGLTDTITSMIKGEINQNSTYESRLFSESRSIQVADHMLKKYGLRSDSDPMDLEYDHGAYKVGLCDGHKYFGQTCCKEAFLNALKKRSETARKKVG